MNINNSISINRKIEEFDKVAQEQISLLFREFTKDPTNDPKQRLSLIEVLNEYKRVVKDPFIQRFIVEKLKEIENFVPTIPLNKQEYLFKHCMPILVEFIQKEGIKIEELDFLPLKNVIEIGYFSILTKIYAIRKKFNEDNKSFFDLIQRIDDPQGMFQKNFPLMSYLNFWQLTWVWLEN